MPGRRPPDPARWHLRGAVKTFNKRGDQGETSLLYGARVAKSDLRCEAYGALDEANSALGLARNWAQPRTAAIVESLQRELFVVGGELATPLEHHDRLRQQFGVVTTEMVERIEGLIDDFEAATEMPQSFILPGGCPSGAALDLARAIIRRAERRVVSLKEMGAIANDELLRYLNRLADLIYTLARYEEKHSAEPERGRP